METLIKYPELVVLNGQGNFKCIDLEFDSDFEITHFPDTTLIEVQIPEKYVSFSLISFNLNYWTLNGKLDNEINIKAENLMLDSINGSHLKLISYKDFNIGNDEINSFDSGHYPLTGIYTENFKIDYKGYSISCEGVKDQLLQIEKLAKLWNKPFEGCTLVVKKNNAPKEDLFSTAKSIASLLSLSTGNSVAFNRQQYFINTDKTLEHWRRMVDYNHGAERCVPDFTMDKFLLETLDNYTDWDKDKKKILFSTVEYINSSNKGYIEDRLLRISIAWEGIALSWLEKNPTKNQDIQALKKHLKSSINNFTLPESIDKNFVKNRVLSSLDWEKLYETLNAIISQFNLDSEELSLDFKSLIKVRNDIAHTGLLRQKYAPSFLPNLLYNHKFALQVLLLKELGYSGLVQTHEEKWKSFEKMEKFII